jgi:tetratricopeptide (TPR) repeat protein
VRGGLSINEVLMSALRVIRRSLRRLTWRAAFKGTPAFLKSLKAWRNHDDPTALAYFEQFLEVYPDPAAEYMAFYATLLVLNSRFEQAKSVFSKVLKGLYRPLRWPTRSQYAIAFSHYFLALLQRRPDVIELWLTAQRLRPKKGFGATYLLLGDNPLPISATSG